MDTNMDALLVKKHSDGVVVHDTSMLDRQVEWSCSSESRQEEIVQVSMHGELEQVTFRESQ